MSLINRTFNGKLNLDVSPYRVPPNDYIEALNITRDAQGSGQDRIVSNIIGNRKVLYTLPAGTNKRIGSEADPLRNRIYYWVWNSNGYNLWLYYDKTTDSIVKLIEDLTDTDGIPVLDFNPSFRINHCDIIYRDEGDLVSWTDGHTSPKEANVLTILAGTYGVIQKNFIEAAKAPPLTPPIAGYGTDTSILSNSLRKKLFQFSSAFQYDTFALSTPSAYSKIALPIGYYGSDNDNDDNANNFITISIETGDKNVTDLVIYMRYNIDDAWSDFVTIIKLNKAQLNISDNITYQYLFYNDNIYPEPTANFQYVDGIQAVPLFDWIPQLANTQCQPNGNIKAYGAITENYDNYPVSELDVTITAENQTNIPPDSDPPTLTYTQIDSLNFRFGVFGTIPTGTEYVVYLFFNGNVSTGQTHGTYKVIDYTSIIGDTDDDVATAIASQFNAYASTPALSSMAVANGVSVLMGTTGNLVTQIIVTPGSSGSNISTEKTWLWQSNYIFGLVYLDEQNRDMPGVTTFTNPINSNNDFAVTTPEFSVDSGNAQTPVISASINHLPLSGAVKYCWVRRRQTYADFIFYETCDYQDPSDGYLYFCLANIDLYKANNSKFIYDSAPITGESRIKIVAGINFAGFYNGVVYAQDYQILGTVTRTITGGTSPDDDRLFIKVVKPSTPISPAYTTNMLAMVYVPAINPTSDKDAVYWEWGETYDIYTGYVFNYSGLTGTFSSGLFIVGVTSGASGTVVTDNGSNSMVIKDITGTFIIGETLTAGFIASATLDSISAGAQYHAGQQQDQTSMQPATFIWDEGDVYIHVREMYWNILNKPPNGNVLPIMDANFSDFFNSAVNDNGRAQVIAANARRQFNPVLIRFSEAYQSGTIVNGLNRFYFENFVEEDRSWGNIEKLFIDRRYLYVFQEFNTGVVPILTQIVRDTQGNPLEANSDILLNKITYPYDKQYGIGNVPESFAYGKSAMYGIDNNKGIVWRLSGNGMEAISVLYECNAFFVAKLAAYKSDLNNGYAPLNGVYTGNATCYGIFDSYTNKYIISLEEINRYNSQGSLIFHQDAETLSFLETRDEDEGFESNYSYHSEGMDSLNNLLVSFKNGEFWKHDSSTYCSFYGQQYTAYITSVFNDAILQKKSWQALTLISEMKWSCPVIYTNVNSYGTTKQESELIEEDFELFEQYPSAGLLRDKNSIGGLLNGDWMKGSFIVIRFQKNDASNLVILAGVGLVIKDSALTAQ